MTVLGGDVSVTDGIKIAIMRTGVPFDCGGQSGFVFMEPTDQPWYVNARFPFDTVVSSPGKLLETECGWHMSLSVVPEMFSGLVVQYNAILLTCNMSFDIERQTEERNADYTLSSNFVSVMADAVGARLDMDEKLSEDEKIGKLMLESDMLYVPEAYGVKLGDRMAMDGRKFMVVSVKTNKFPGVAILGIGDDTR